MRAGTIGFLTTAAASALIFAVGFSQPGAIADPPQYYFTKSVSKPTKSGKAKLKIKEGLRKSPHQWETHDIEVDVTTGTTSNAKAQAIADAINAVESLGTATANQNIVTYVPSSNSTVHSSSTFSGKDTGEKDGVTRSKNDGAAPIPPGGPPVENDTYDPDRVRPTWVLEGTVDGNPIVGTGANILELGLFRQVDPTTVLDIDIDVPIQLTDTLITLGDRAVIDFQQAIAQDGYPWTVLGRPVRLDGLVIEYEITFADPLPPGTYTVIGGNNDETLEGPSVSHASRYLDADNH